MLLASLYIISADNRPDDVIRIQTTTSRRLMVVFEPGEPGCKKTIFFMNSHCVMSYIDDILQSMRMDIDPFEELQVTTRIHPSVLFHVSDLDKRDTRHLILGMVETALKLRFRTSA